MFIELTEVCFVIAFVIVSYVGWWSNKTGNILTDLCLDVFRFLSLTMKVTLSSYTVFKYNRTHGY